MLGLIYFFSLCVLNDSALLCTTAEGWLQRVVVLGTETHVIEEIQLFETPQPVDSLTISHSKVRRNSPRPPGTTPWKNPGNTAAALQSGGCFRAFDVVGGGA